MFAKYPFDRSGSAVVIHDGSMNGSLTTQGHKIWEVKIVQENLWPDSTYPIPLEQDTNVEDIRGIPEFAVHRKVDLECVSDW